MLILEAGSDFLLLDPLATDTLVLITSIAESPIGGSFFCDACAIYLPGSYAVATFSGHTVAFAFVPGSRAEQSFTPADLSDSFTPGAVAPATAGNC